MKAVLAFDAIRKSGTHRVIPTGTVAFYCWDDQTKSLQLKKVRRGKAA